MAFIQYYVSRDGKGFCVHATSAKSCIPFFFSFLNQTYPLVLMLLAKV